MKIQRLEIDGYRSLLSQTWLPGELNVVIGPNASGKSNLLRALELLRVAAAGKLDRLVQAEGGIDAMSFDGTAARIGLGVELVPYPEDGDEILRPLRYDLRLDRLGSTYRIGLESVCEHVEADSASGSDEVKWLNRDAHSFAILDPQTHELKSVRIPPFSGRSEKTPFPLSESLLSEMGGPLATITDLAELQRQMSDWAIFQDFDARRESMLRSPQVTRRESRIDSNGENLIAVLHTLYTVSREFKEDLDLAMRAAFGDDFEELVFPPAADQRIQLRVRWRSLKREQSAADLSDGTLRFLFLIAILASPVPPPLIAIDEPETGLHPSMFRIVAEFAREASRHAQVIFTTHSPEFLDAFGSDPPTTTVVERREGRTFLRAIAGDELDYWLKQYTLGELFRSNELEAMS